MSSTIARTSTSLAVAVASAIGFAACSSGSEVTSTDTSATTAVEETTTTEVELEVESSTSLDEDEADPESQPRTESDPEPEQRTESEPESEPQTEAETESESETESDNEPGSESDESAAGLGGDHAEVLANAPAVIAEISETLTTEVLDPADANCSYLDQEDSAATRLNNWRIGRDEFLGIPHDVTLSERQEQRSLVEITSDYGYTEETLLIMAEILHTECHNRAFEAGDLSEQQAITRTSSAIANFEELMNSVPDEEGRGAGPRAGGDED